MLWFNGSVRGFEKESLIFGEFLAQSRNKESLKVSEEMIFEPIGLYFAPFPNKNLSRLYPDFPFCDRGMRLA
jgi:hypothetical protein